MLDNPKQQLTMVSGELSRRYQTSLSEEAHNRRLLGLKCDRDRECARRYFLKATSYHRDECTDEIKAVARGLLCEWYWQTTLNYVSVPATLRHVFAAWHHAEQSALYCIAVSGPDHSRFASKVVLSSVAHMSGTAIARTDMRIWYPVV